MMKLYYVPGVCSLSPNIVWREAGLTNVETKLVDRTTKRVDGDVDYNRINPKGYVPALQLEDGSVLTEGSVIVQYLADLKPESRLAPKMGTPERWKLMEWLNFLATEIHKGYSPLFATSAPKEIRDAQMARLSTRMGYVEEQLRGKKFLMGDTFTVADAYLFTVNRWSERTGFDLAKFPAVKEHFERVKARPKVQEALKAEGLPT